MAGILRILSLGFPWDAPNPFLFCVFHEDHYPQANADQGPDAPLDGRDLGQDFAGKDGWRMYHGREVPGFPQHPHRGFETVTIVRRGFIDHSDSLGATARYGEGDVQWLTAGKGILHSEMFPLTRQDAPNPVELFQIWLNLPRADKLAPPHFSMMWHEDIPQVASKDGDTLVTLIAGALDGKQALPPAPRSWAARPENDVAIWTVKLAARAQWTLPPASPGTHRRIYLFRGRGTRIAGQALSVGQAADLEPTTAVAIENGLEPAELLLLQGRPIDEPVVHHGPFVMTSKEEIAQTIREYQQTEFGGWRFASDEPVHRPTDGRFARRPDGTVERPRG